MWGARPGCRQVAPPRPGCSSPGGGGACRGPPGGRVRPHARPRAWLMHAATAPGHAPASQAPGTTSHEPRAQRLRLAIAFQRLGPTTVTRARAQCVWPRKSMQACGRPPGHLPRPAPSWPRHRGSGEPRARAAAAAVRPPVLRPPLLLPTAPAQQCGWLLCMQGLQLAQARARAGARTADPRGPRSRSQEQALACRQRSLLRPAALRLCPHPLQWSCRWVGAPGGGWLCMMAWRRSSLLAPRCCPMLPHVVCTQDELVKTEFTESPRCALCARTPALVGPARCLARCKCAPQLAATPRCRWDIFCNHLSGEWVGQYGAFTPWAAEPEPVWQDTKGRCVLGWGASAANGCRTGKRLCSNGLSSRTCCKACGLPPQVHGLRVQPLHRVRKPLAGWGRRGARGPLCSAAPHRERGRSGAQQPGRRGRSGKGAGAAAGRWRPHGPHPQIGQGSHAGRDQVGNRQACDAAALEPRLACFAGAHAHTCVRTLSHTHTHTRARSRLELLPLEGRALTDGADGSVDVEALSNDSSGVVFFNGGNYSAGPEFIGGSSRGVPDSFPQQEHLANR